MRAGLLDRKIEIISVTAEPPPDEPWGETVVTETVVAAPWANFMQENAREWLRDGIISTETKAVFRTRYINGISTSHVIDYAGKRWDLTEVREIGRRKGLDLYATRRT